MNISEIKKAMVRKGTVEEARNRRTTQYLILWLIRERESTLKSLKIRLRAAVNNVIREDNKERNKKKKRKNKEGHFYFMLPGIPHAEKVDLRVVIAFWIDQGVVAERIRKGKNVLCMTKKGEKNLSFLTCNSDGIGLNSTARELYNGA